MPPKRDEWTTVLPRERGPRLDPDAAAARADERLVQQFRDAAAENGFAHRIEGSRAMHSHVIPTHGRRHGLSEEAARREDHPSTFSDPSSHSIGALVAEALRGQGQHQFQPNGTDGRRLLFEYDHGRPIGTDGQTFTRAVFGVPEGFDHRRIPEEYFRTITPIPRLSRGWASHSLPPASPHRRGGRIRVVRSDPDHYIKVFEEFLRSGDWRDRSRFL